MKWKFWEQNKGLKETPTPTDEERVWLGSEVRVLLADAEQQGYNAGYTLGYAKGVQDTKEKLREVARRLQDGK